ncbi:hypothetical protein PGN35_016925 [Nodosilinea sp. PGN35]|uniref:hypothetical protein n=1 Tax=Nodosilinea sp. PGN35 TaxID=3020489 RepID=UPI0023B2BE19|nr:hypothetical protein [Nodosilinea sp. TSF1-S3]MDF0369524.1 hypothetical protein [Nodosilinea sp. TSF1-S3]
MVKRHHHLPLAILGFGLLWSGFLPEPARAEQTSPAAAPTATIKANTGADASTGADSDAAAAPALTDPEPSVSLPIAGEPRAVLPPALERADSPTAAAAAPWSEAEGFSAASSGLAIAPDQALAANTYLTTAAELAGPEPNALAQLDLSATPLAQDPELGVIQVRSLLEDNDLGILRIRDQPQIPVATARPPAKIGFLTARLAIASSDNILLAINDVGGLTGDTFLRPSVALGVYPSLGPQTAFIATADLGLQRYSTQSALNYDDLRLRVGVRQGLTPRSYGQLIFTYQELYRPGGNRGRFFKNTALGLTLGRRDPITPQLALDTYYLLQYNGAQSTSSGTATDFSRIFQSAGGYLGYDITPQLQAGISYQLNLIDYTAQDRYDTFQQVLGQVVYRITPGLRLNVYGGVSFGRSSEPRVQFNDTFFGAAIDATIPLF